MNDPERFDDGIMPMDWQEPRERFDKSYKSGDYRGPLPGQQRECKACGAPLVFARTKDGQVMPITLTVKLGGNILVFKAEDGLVECRTIPPGECLDTMREQTVPLRKSHFADCPRADEFRKQRIKGRADARSSPNR